MAAKSTTLGQLHEMFAAYCINQMSRTDEEGKPVPVSAAELAVIRAFLKDNNVQADPADDGDVKDLAKALRNATEGTVTASELDMILDDFQRQMPGLGNMQ